MRHLFAIAGEKLPETYPYYTYISFCPSEVGWVIKGAHHLSIDDWLENTRQTCLLSGISDYQLAIIDDDPKKTSPNDVILNFYFPDELDCLRFQAIALGDRPMNSPLAINSAGSAMAQDRLKKLKAFAAENEIPMVTSPIHDNKFFAHTATLFNFISLYEYVKGGHLDTLDHVMRGASQADISASRELTQR